MKPPLRNSRMRNEGPRSLLSPSQRYTDAGTSGRRAQRMERHADKWSKRGILSRDISLSGIVEPPPSLLWTPKSSLCYVLIKTWNVSLQICKVICIRMTWWLRQPHTSYLILTLCYPERVERSSITPEALSISPQLPRFMGPKLKRMAL